MANILVVDDAKTSRDEVKITLSELNHNIIEAKDGLEGLKIVESNSNLDLIITDYNMPGLDGIAMLANIKNIANRSHIKSIMLTTETSPELKAKGKELGVIAWVIKPFSRQAFAQAVTKILEMVAKK